MSPKKEKTIDLDNLTPQEALKLEIAAEIGVYDKVISGGWRSLTAKESGRIGGLMTRRKKEAEKVEGKPGEVAVKAESDGKIAAGRKL